MPRIFLFLTFTLNFYTKDNNNSNDTVIEGISNNIFDDLFKMEKNQVFKHKTSDIVEHVPKNLMDLDFHQ